MDYKNIHIIDILSEHIDIKRSLNNKRVYISKECPFCGEVGRRVFRFNTKLKVGKFYCCGISFKEVTKLKEELRYMQWHKDKMCTNYGRFEKFKAVDDNFDLPWHCRIGMLVIPEYSI